jgi:hypothetical protein
VWSLQAAKLDQVDAQNNDGRDYKHAKTQAGGDDTTLTVAAFQAPQAEPSPESEKVREFVPKVACVKQWRTSQSCGLLMHG